jgi:glucosylceramidase
LRRVALDSGGNLGDYARGWDLSASDNGTSWRTPRHGERRRPTDQHRHPADPSPLPADHLTSTASAGNWWTIADIRLYD